MRGSDLASRVVLAAVYLTPVLTVPFRGALGIYLTDVCLLLAGVSLLAQRDRMRVYPVLLSLFSGGYLLAIGYLTASLLGGDFGGGGIALQYMWGMLIVPVIIASVDLRRVLLAYVAGILSAIAFPALVNLVAPSLAIDLFEAEWFVSYRRLGGVTGANGLAKSAVFALPIVWHLRRQGELGIRTSRLAVAVLVAGVLLSGSFAGIIMLCIVGGAIAALTHRLAVVGLLVGLVAVGLVLSGSVREGDTSLLPELWAHRVVSEDGSIVALGSSDAKTRGVIEALGRQSVIEITLGTGAGSARLDEVAESSTTTPSRVHNAFALAFIEAGVVGLAGLMVSLLGPLAVAAAVTQRTGRRPGPAFVLGAAVVLAMATNTYAYPRLWLVPLVLCHLMVREGSDRRIGLSGSGRPAVV